MSYLILLFMIMLLSLLLLLVIIGLVKGSVRKTWSLAIVYDLLLEGIYLVLSSQGLFSLLVSRLHIKLYRLNGPLHTQKDSLKYLAHLLIIVIIILLVFTLLALIQTDPLVIVIGLIFACVFASYKYFSLDRDLLVKRREIIAELPFLLNTLVLLLNAGESLQNAFIRVLTSYRLQAPSNFSKELMLILVELENGLSFVEALENLNQRLAVQEIAIFTSTLILNTRRGNKELSLILENLANEFWSRRLTEARIVGEEASAKLIFPMILIFLVVILVVATPAILIF